MNEEKIILKMEHIEKSFYGVNVLKDVSLFLKEGEIQALMGENGAGKSTLMKILGGIYSKDSGTIAVNGREVEIKTPLAARELRICLVHQEISLVPQLSIADNIFLGSELKRGLLEDKRAMKDKAKKAIETLELNVPATTKVYKLSVAQQQLVEIAKALVFDAKIIILDEPTAAISQKEAESLFNYLKKLKDKGISIIYISHRMEEIFKVCDSITVMRDGIVVANKRTEETDKSEVIAAMVGRSITDFFGNNHPKGTEDILEVKGLNNRYLNNVSFTLKKGEILGFAGLVGAGRTELARAIFGLDKIESGEIYLNGERIKCSKPYDAMKCGIGLIPEDRKQSGLFLEKSISYNLTLLVLKKFIRGIFVNDKRRNEIIKEYSEKLTIKMAGIGQHCAQLSGGNQQKVVISKWLAYGPKVLIMDEPTRGVDVGAKAEIYHLINNLANEGYSIMMISSELPEIINMSSRIVVMHEGRITGILDGKETEFVQEEIMNYAIGGKVDEKYKS
ncbi:sugar ABC transporter ATP-binding protein [Dorea sp. D27]|uniref:sugar ABC transporter ATP-binding protein n=1 Tax=Dorea sp. D27 TaxID=658665 RepID=UPI000673B404|nr:sugar ABC transporter ATP-binding protein [Dorea sp. D27]KMZ53539.1 ribose ABC transporter, ATP-binding protein [Dorea sp. D27]